MDSPSSAKPPAAPSILLICSKDEDPSLQRFREKVWNTARFNPEWLAEADWTEGKLAIWRAIKAAPYRYVVAEGREVTKALLKGKSAFRLAEFVGVVQRPEHLPHPLLPIPSFRVTMGRGRAEVEDLVRIWARLTHTLSGLVGLAERTTSEH